VTGTVTNKATAEPLGGVQIYLQNTSYGAITDTNGRFTITGISSGTYTLVATYIGFAQHVQRNVGVTAASPVTLTLQLAESVLPLQELVVSGSVDPTAGIKLPFTVSRVGADQLQVPNSGSALGAIAGKVAGASVIRGSGEPGSGFNILLRSGTALEGVVQNDPLLVVDGVILSRDFGNTTADIDPADIESVEVIKGAAAASIYGSRAAAGVVSITTKRGRNTPIGTTRVNYRMEIGQDFIGREMPLSLSHHYRMNAGQTGFVDEDGNPVDWGDRETDPNRRIQDRPYPGPTYNNIKALFQPAQVLQQNVTVSQNSQSTTLFIALNRLDERATLTNNDGFWRNQGRISVDHRVGDRFSISLTGLHSRSWSDGTSGNPYTTALTYPPFVDLAKKGPDGQYLQLPDSSVLTENPLWRQATRDNFDVRARTNASANVRFSPFHWISLDGQFSYDRADNNGQIYVPKGVPTSVTQDVPSQGSLELSDQRADAYNGAIAATVLRQIGDLNVRTRFQATMERSKSESFNAVGEDFVVQGVRRLDAAATLDDIESSSSDSRTNGYMVNLGADFKDRYVVDALVRRDGSSVFGPDRRWHTYYRGALSYRMSAEPWFNVPQIDELVFRYSIGTAGGRPRFNQQYELWNVNRSGGLSRNSAGNATLKPQFTREQEWGINSILLGNRLSLELVYARQVSKDQIIGLPTPTLTGFNTVAANAGIVEGWTYEATVNARLLQTQDVTVQVAAVFDHSGNEIKEWGRSCFYGHTIASELSNHEYSCAGASRGDFWGQRHTATTAELPPWAQDHASEFQLNDEGYLVWVGEGNSPTEGLSKSLWGTSSVIGPVTYQWGEPFMIVDQNNVPVFHKIGTSRADVNFGFTPNLRWKNMSLYAELRGQLGGNVYNDAKQDLYNALRHADLDQTGKPDEMKKTIDYYQRGLRAGGRFVPAFIEDGTYLKVGALSGRYRFTRAQLQRVFGSFAPNDVSLGVTARNLFTFTGYSGYDPDTGRALSRIEQLGYPQMRTLTMMFDITF
jgi:TonB-linked SusC/RagA family outer membrane protein